MVVVMVGVILWSWRYYDDSFWDDTDDGRNTRCVGLGATGGRLPRAEVVEGCRTRSPVRLGWTKL